MVKYKPSKGQVVPDVEHYRSINPYDNFRWTAGSDVQKVWRRHGWTPPTEYRNDYLFKLNREANNG
jgi:hypothetical protein